MNPRRLLAAFTGEATPADRFATTAVCAIAALAGWLAMRADLAPLGAAFVVVAYLAGGVRTLGEAIGAISRGLPDINFLMIFAAVVSAALGFWDEGALLLFLFSLSDALERYAVERTRSGIRSLMNLRPPTACIVRDGVEQVVGIEMLRVGDVTRVRPGERFAIDGEIVDGFGSIDESIVTGESVAVEKRIGDSVFAGTINATGSLLVRMTRPESESTLSRIVRMVEDAQENKARAQRTIERWQTPYVLGVLAISTLTILLGWIVAGDLTHAIKTGMILLVAASPCAVVLASPVAVLAAVTRGARLGVLFKGGAHLETLAAVNALALDKTGTLTFGKPRVSGVMPLPGSSEADVLALAAGLESHSEHPLAKAVVAEAAARGVKPVAVESFQNCAGFGVTAFANGHVCIAGRAALFQQLGLKLPDALRELSESTEGATGLIVWRDGGPAGVITLVDTVRPDAREALSRLHQAGVRNVVMLTGDRSAPARRVAAELGIDRVMAELNPEQKLDEIRRLASEGHGVAMVGDGVNDAPALAAASVGIAMGRGGSDVAMETADVVLMRDDLKRLADAVVLARQTRATIRGSLTFAFSVIAVLIVLTFAGVLTLPLAVVGHEGSTVLVVLNGLRLLRSSE